MLVFFKLIDEIWGAVGGQNGCSEEMLNSNSRSLNILLLKYPRTIKLDKEEMISTRRGFLPSISSFMDSEKRSGENILGRYNE